MGILAELGGRVGTYQPYHMLPPAREGACQSCSMSTCSNLAQFYSEPTGPGKARHVMVWWDAALQVFRPNGWPMAGSWSAWHLRANLAGIHPRLSQGLSTPPWPCLGGICTPRRSTGLPMQEPCPPCQGDTQQRWLQVGWGKPCSFAGSQRGAGEPSHVLRPAARAARSTLPGREQVIRISYCSNSFSSNIFWLLFTTVRPWWGQFSVFEKEAICSKSLYWLVRCSKSRHLPALSFSFVKQESQ